MSLKFDSIEDADQSLSIIKKQDEIIKIVYEIYLKKYPKFNKEGIVKMIAEKSGKSRSTVWDTIMRSGGNSSYEKTGLKFL
jgi:hypothetical protein